MALHQLFGALDASRDDAGRGVFLETLAERAALAAVEGKHRAPSGVRPVPATLLMAIRTLESDNGTGDMGKLPVIRTLATLAHDCRRSELFQGELLAALQIVQRGDLYLRDLIGAYAGEIGQTQFLPSSYVKYGVDYDGDGHVDLRHSVPDVLASTANLLRTNGWRAGAPFGEGTANFEVMSEWNRSVMYRKPWFSSLNALRALEAHPVARGPWSRHRKSNLLINRPRPWSFTAA